MKNQIKQDLDAIESHKLELEGMLNDILAKLVPPGHDAALGTPVRVLNAGSYVRDDIPPLFAAVSISNIAGQFVLENEAGDRLNSEELGVDDLLALCRVLLDKVADEPWPEIKAPPRITTKVRLPDPVLWTYPGLAK